jgi:hypothetical protein
MGQQSQCPMCGIVFVIPVVQTPAAPAGWMPGYGQPGAVYQPGTMQGYPGPMPGGMAYPGGAPGYPGMFPGAPNFPGIPAAAPPDAAFPEMMPGFPSAPVEQGFPDLETGPTIEFPQHQTEPEQPFAPVTADSHATTAEPAPEPAPEKQEPRIVRIPCPQGHELQTPMDMIGQEVLCPFCSTQFHLKYENSVEFMEERAESERRREEQLNRTALKSAIIAAVIVVLGIISMIVYLAVRSPAPAPSSPPAHNEPSDGQVTPEADESPAAEDDAAEDE